MTGDSSPQMLIESELKSVTEMLSAVRGLLISGDVMDLTPLGERLEDLCRKIEENAPLLHDRKTIERNVERVIRELGKLEKDLHRVQGDARDG